MLETLGEAFALVQHSDIPAEQFLALVNDALFHSPLYENYGKRIAERAFTPAGFRLTLGLKDVDLVINAAERVAVPMPIASVLHDRFLSAVARGLKDVDWSAVGQH